MIVQNYAKANKKVRSDLIKKALWRLKMMP